MKANKLNRLLSRLQSRDWNLSNYSNGPQDDDEFEYFASTLDDFFDDFLDDEMYSSVEDVIDELRERSDARDSSWMY